MLKPRTLIFALLLAGCGGSGGTTPVEGTSGAVAVAFSNATDFNGSTAAITSYSSLSGSASGKSISISVTNGSRSIETFFLADSLAAGTTVDLSSATGSSVVYGDATGQWAATSGTVKIDSISSVGVQLSFSNVVLTNSSSGTTGSVTLSGTVAFVSG